MLISPNRRNEKKRQKKRLVTTMKVWMFAVFCLPFSLWNSMVLAFPLSDLSSDPAMMLTLLHLLCTAQFCLNFIVYTILCGPVGQTYLTLFSRAKFSVLSVFQRNSTEISLTSTASISRQNSSSIKLTDYQPQDTYL